MLNKHYFNHSGKGTLIIELLIFVNTTTQAKKDF
jgi:hypothetical protein